jgi:NAD+ kinase
MIPMSAHSAPLRRLAFVVNRAKPGAGELALALAETARRAGVETRITDTFPVPAGFLAGQDACCVLGGDGTLLSVVNEAVAAQTAVFGINRGKLGFLVTLSVSEAQESFSRILAGEYQLTYRTVIRARTADNRTALALNDIVLKHPSLSRLVALEVYSNDELVTEYHCDGLIFATPTGSTAYNLSAGGPLIHPDAQAWAMTPICPHTLSNRAVIFAREAHLRVHNLDAGCLPSVTCDGDPRFADGEVFPLALDLDHRTLPLLKPPGHSHFEILRSKLKWGEEPAPPS